MLVELNIRNFAIIKDLRVQFTRGLNLLTGETGSGKSIIIEALGIILGGRGTKELIRTGEEKSFLQAVFLVEHLDKMKSLLDKHGIEIEENRLLIISREISLHYPSMSRINGRTVTLSILNEITSNLVDIFAQHEHQSLLNIVNHKTLIDSFGDKDFKDLKLGIKIKHIEYTKEKKALSQMNLDSSQREREIDLLRYQIEEIENSNLDNEDEVELENEFNKISNIKSIKSSIEEILEEFNSDNYEKISVLKSINRSVGILNNILKYDSNLKEFFDRLEDINFELRDISDELNHYSENMDINEEKLYDLNEKIDILNRLKKKYGNTIEEILKYKENASNKLEKLLNYEYEIENHKTMVRKYEKELNDLSLELSNKRKIIAKELEKRISYELKDLNMGNITFKVNFSKNSILLSDGFDIIEFLISTNIGEDLKSMSKIVSGGEMSRIMLGFKSILADYDGIPTLIFDEIDTGISGRTAQVVGEKIYDISKKRQVISISHLPQIAALADSHYVISKRLNKDKKINTNIVRLTDEERVIELGRLLGGVDVTDTTLKHAREMLDMTKKIKK
ncbi:DNA repair protein RecN [Tissierella creatinophila]|uniref:DNA repair protein RecN n=1 Tax=Tissierella creatinophila DSM 6911 TaxID=1123403 RepID=A0A1U7M9I4_TISCR|nr:DNA repair protein RecN [Tissierella creatinophila]OLS03946.1 DNA repair protein RecN [Tissierella creatinophila DSM 6911]